LYKAQKEREEGIFREEVDSEDELEDQDIGTFFHGWKVDQMLVDSGG
jgi:hypothetical protein